MYLVFKVLLTALLIVGASELAKKSVLASTLMLALPFTSVLALIWIYVETKDLDKISEVSWGVFWLVPPSLIFFPVLSLVISKGFGFYLALVAAVIAAALTYVAYAKLLTFFGIQL